MKTVRWLIFMMFCPFTAIAIELLSLINDGGLGGTDGLKGTLSVAISHDGKNVYMISTLDSAIVTLDRKTKTGALIYGRCNRNGQDGIDGLRGGVSLAISPDDKNVYVVGTLDSALVIFSRDASTGRLAYLTHLTDEKIGGKMLGCIRSLAVSPDNKNVYAAGTDSILVVFNRDATSGALSFSHLFRRNGPDSVSGLSTASSVVVSPDNKNVYVAGFGDSAIVVFNRDLSSGALTYSTCLKNNVDGVEGLACVISLAVSPDSKNVYAVGLYDYALAVFNRDLSNGALSYSMCFNRDKDGIQGLNTPLSVVVSADNKNVFVANPSDSSLVVFSRDPTNGSLIYDKRNGFHGLRGAHSVTISPDSKNIYVTSADDSLCPVSILNRDAVTKAFSCIVTTYEEVDGFESPMTVAVSPDNKSVYIAGAVDNGLATFNRDTITGLLTFRSCLQDGRGGVDGMENPRAMAVSPDNKNVYVVSLEDSGLAVFNRDTATGALIYSMCFKRDKDGIQGLNGAISVVVSADNKNVYVASMIEKVLMVFRRNVSTGTLTYETSIENDFENVDGIWSPHCVAVSPDNKNVYVVASGGKHSLVVFNRKETDGSLQFDTCYYSSYDGKIRFIYPNSVTVSPDNKTVYITSSDALTIFNRDTTTGRLFLTAHFENGQDGVDGLETAQCVAVSPDNKTVYVVGWDGFALFNHDLVTGTTTFDRCVNKWKNGFGELAIGCWVAVSPDGKNVYAAAGGLAVFSVQPIFKVPVKNRDDRMIQRTVGGNFTMSKNGSELMLNMAAPGNVDLSLYDAKGRLVRQLHSGYLKAGRHRVKTAFEGIPKGFYLLRLSGCTADRAVKVINCN